MDKTRKHRKPKLDEVRVKVIAATFEREIGSADFEIVGVNLCDSDRHEWMVIVKPILEGRATYDGGEKLVMVNDAAGKARYYSDYLSEHGDAAR